MIAYFSKIVFLLELCSPLIQSVQSPYGDGTWGEKALLKDLLHDYEQRARPVVDGVSKEIDLGNITVQQITVEFGLALIQILQLNENEQILTVSVKMLYRWPDYHLIWNPEEYDNITHVTIPVDKIWIPDVALYNYADERLEEVRTCAARVSHNGMVDWQPMAIYKSTCPVKIKYFPYDQQHCFLRFGLWTYDNGRVNISGYQEDWNLKDYQVSPEWRLIHHDINIRNRKYACCAEIFSDMFFHMTIERQPAYYNYLLILPCFLLSSLTLILFWLPPETPAKMVLGMNIFLAFFLLLLLLKNSIPSASSSFPLIGNYYCCNMTLVTVSTFLCLIVVNLHFRGDRVTEVPAWLKKLALEHGARFLYVNVGLPKQPSPKPQERNHTFWEGQDRRSMPFYTAHSNFFQPNIIYPHPEYNSQYCHQTLPTSPQFPDETRPNGSGDYMHRGSLLPMNTINDNKPLQLVDDPNRSCVFCPACTGLAAAAAATEASIRLPKTSKVRRSIYEPQAATPGLLPIDNSTDDPTEELTAAWTAAMSGSLPSEHVTRSRHSEQREADSGPDIESFVLACFDPYGDHNQIRNEDKTNSEACAHKSQYLRYAPLSSSHPFSSPHCEDDSDESVNLEWGSRRQKKVSRSGGAEDVIFQNDDDDDDDDSDEAEPTALWQPHDSNTSHNRSSRPSIFSDPVMLKRVQGVKKDITEIVRSLRYLQRQNEKKQRKNRILNEWRAVGMVLDRLFFVLCLCALGISIIIYFPRSGHETDDSS